MRKVIVGVLAAITTIIAVATCTYVFWGVRSIPRPDHVWLRLIPITVSWMVLVGWATLDQILEERE